MQPGAHTASSPPPRTRRERLLRSASPLLDSFEDEYEDEILAHMIQTEVRTNLLFLGMLDNRHLFASFCSFRCQPFLSAPF